MGVIQNIKDRIEDEKVDYKKLYLECKRNYKIEYLRNDVYSNVILQLALAGKIDSKTQQLFYDMVNGQMDVVYKYLF